MPNNIFPGPNFATAKQTKTFAELGLNASNTNVVFGVVDGGYKSWRPDRLINGISGVTAASSYLINAKVAIDKTEFFTPPLPTGGTGGANVWDDTKIWAD